MRQPPFLSRVLSCIAASLHGADWRTVAATLAVGSAGAFAFSLTGIPAAVLSGAMIAVAVFAMLGFRTEVPDPLRDLCFFAVGIAMGVGVNPQAVSRAVQWPVSIAILTAAVFAIGASVYVYLHRFAHWDRKTAFYACIPGALTFVMALAARSDADIRFVVVSQSIRLFFLVAILPVVLLALNVSPPAAAPAGEVVDVADAALLVTAAAAATALLHLARVPAANMVGPFIASSALYGAGFVTGAIHPFILNGGLVALGAMIGSRFGGIEPALLRRLVTVSLGALAVGLAVAVCFAALTVLVTGLAFGQVLLAFAPGGLEAMVILAFLFHLDPAYVAAHQVARLVGMMLFLPAIVALLSPRAR